MSNVCTICNHARRIEIDRQIVEGKNLSQIAKTFDVPYHSIYQHSQKHISRQLATVMEKKLTIEGNELMEVITKIIHRAERIFRRNEKAGKDLLALKALDSQRNTIMLLSNISAQLHSAKMAELQLAKDNGEDRQAQLQKQFEINLAILSTDELLVYERLVNKINHQNGDKIISQSRVLVKNCNENKNSY